MALGRMSSLGVGSNVLNYDMIDKLRKADESSYIKPIDKNLEKNVEKQTELVELTNLVRDVKSNTRVLSDYSTYLGRSHEVIGNEVKATISDGVPIQDIRLDIDSIAQNDVNEVGSKFSQRDSVFSQKDSILRFFTKGKVYEVDIKAGMTLEDVAQLITDETKGEVIGSIMKTGGQHPYQLMINSKDTGEQNRIYFGETLRGGTIKAGEIDIKDDDFTVTLADKKGGLKTLQIALKTSKSAKTDENVESLRDAIKQAISEDSDFEGLLDSEINIGIGSNDSLVINDIRGYEVQVGGDSARILGFKENSSQSDKEERKKKDLVYGEPVQEGYIDGIIRIGSVPLDLSKLTQRGNSSYKNAKIVARAIDNIAGIHSYATKDGRIVINSDTGEVSIIPDEDGGKSEDALKRLGLQRGSAMDYTRAHNDLFKIRNIQTAKDAEFSYNGIKMRRASNQIDDIATGVNIELLAPTQEGKPAMIHITRNDEEVIENIVSFVENYNKLSTKLDEVTRYDEDTKIAGVFNGDSDIRAIRPALNKILSFNTGGIDRQTLVKYGITVNEHGLMTLDSGKLRSAINEDPQAAQEFFQGKVVTREFRDVEIDGVFKMLDKELSLFVDSGKSRLKLLEESLTTEDKKLKDDKRRATEMLDARYDLMAQRFANYDSQIAKANNSFNAVQMMIDQSIANKKS